MSSDFYIRTKHLNVFKLVKIWRTSLEVLNMLTFIQPYFRYTLKLVFFSEKCFLVVDVCVLSFFHNDTDISTLV